MRCATRTGVPLLVLALVSTLLAVAATGSWSACRSGTSAALMCVTFGGGRFVAVGSDGTDMGRPRMVKRRTRATRPDVSVPAVLHLLSQGMTLPQIQRSLRCSTVMVRKMLREAGLMPKGHRGGCRRPDVLAEEVARLRAQGMTIAALMRHFHCAEDVIKRRLAETTP